LRIQDKEHGIAVLAFLGVPLLDGFPRQEKPHAAALGSFPVLGEHF
jgi:hypothetical protein